MSEKDMKNTKEFVDLCEDTWRKSVAATLGIASMPVLEYLAFNSSHSLPYAIGGSAASLIYGTWYGLSDMKYHRKQLAGYKK